MVDLIDWESDNFLAKKLFFSVFPHSPLAPSCSSLRPRAEDMYPQGAVFFSSSFSFLDS